MSSSRVARPVSLVPAGPGGLAHFAADIFSAIDISANSLGQRVICSTMLFVSNRLCILMIKRKRISSSDKKMFSFTSESLTDSNWYCAAAASCVSNVGKGTPRFILKYQVQAYCQQYLPLLQGACSSGNLRGGSFGLARRFLPGDCGYLGIVFRREKPIIGKLLFR